MSQRKLNKIHDLFDEIMDDAQDAAYVAYSDSVMYDSLVERRERLHMMLDNLRKAEEVDDLVERTRELNFHDDYDPGTD